MELVVKAFRELTTAELYELLRVRAEIFVVEQNCVYQDLDGTDYESLHVFYKEEDGSVSAYLRIFPKQGSTDTMQMGRVLTRVHGQGLGGQLLKEGIKQAFAQAWVKKIFIEAQCYAIGFYAKEGFIVSSEEFLEDGIPHVQMLLPRE